MMKMSEFSESTVEEGETDLMNGDVEYEYELQYVPTFMSALIENVRNSSPEHVTELKIDSLTGTATRRGTVILSNGKLYDSSLLVDYILQTGDHRDPHSGYTFNHDDIIALSQTWIDDHDRERVLNAVQSEEVPLSPKTSAIKYFEDSVTLLGIQLLASCELTSITNLIDLQDTFETVWVNLIKSFCALILLNPLSSTTSASKLQSVFSNALASCDDEHSYVYETTAILPIATAIRSLSSNLGQGVLKGNTSEVIKRIQHMKPVRLLF